MRKIIAATALVAAVAVAAGCGGAGAQGGGGGSTGGRVTGDLATANTAKVEKGTGEITMAIEKTISSWNTLTAAGDISETVWVTTPIYPAAFTIQPDGSDIALNKDMMASAEVVSQHPTVVKYEIRPEATWSDGVPITGEDFEYQWRALNGRDCPKCQTKDTEGLDRVKSIKTADEGKTVTVTYDGDFSEWKRPFSRLQPAHIAEKHGDITTSFNDYFAKTVPTWSGGPYRISDFKKDVSVTLEPNPKWYGPKPNLQKITFRMITDTQQTPLAMQNGEIQAMYPQPQVDLLDQVANMEGQGIAYQMNQSLVMETLQFNLSNSILADPKLRKAIYTALDRQEIIGKTVGQFDKDVKPLGSVMIMQQQKGYQSKVEKFGYGNGNIAGAKKMLTKAGYTVNNGKLITPDGRPVPGLRTVYSVGNQTRKASMEVLQATVKQLGISLQLETTDSLGDTTEENAPYGYDILIVGYTGSPFLAANAKQRFTTGTGYNQHYSNTQVDALVDKALSATDPDTAVELINKADEKVIEDAFMMPLYQKPSLLVYDGKYGNMRDNPTISGPTYNIGEWGLRSGS